MAKVLKKSGGKKKSKNKGGHNQQSHDKRDRAVVFREANRKLDSIAVRRQALADEEKVVKQTLIKGELGMKVKHFMTGRELAAMDPEVRSDLFGAIREQFAATTKAGEQVDFLKIMQEEDEALIAARPMPISLEPVEAYEAGRKVGLARGSREDNIYDKQRHSLLFKKWNEGHHDGLMDSLTAGGTEAARAAAE